MHTLTRLILSALVVAFAACTDSVDELEVDEATTAKADGLTTWLKVYDCDGAAVLDVDSGERRNLQFVIRDPGIVEYLNTASMLELTDFVNAGHGLVAVHVGTGEQRGRRRQALIRQRRMTGKAAVRFRRLLTRRRAQRHQQEDECDPEQFRRHEWPISRSGR